MPTAEVSACSARTGSPSGARPEPSSPETGPGALCRAELPPTSGRGDSGKLLHQSGRSQLAQPAAPFERPLIPEAAGLFLLVDGLLILMVDAPRPRGRE